MPESLLFACSYNDRNYVYSRMPTEPSGIKLATNH